MLLLFSISQVVLLVITQICVIRFLGVTPEHEQILLLQGLFVIVSTSLGTVSYNYWLPRFVLLNEKHKRDLCAAQARCSAIIYYLLPLILFFSILAILLALCFEVFDDIKSQFIPLIFLVAISSSLTALLNLEIALLRASDKASFVELANLLAAFAALGAIISLGENLTILSYSVVIALKAISSYTILISKNISGPMLKLNHNHEWKSFNSIFIPNVFVRVTQFADKLIVLSLGPGALIVWNFALQIISCGNTLVDKAVNSRAIPSLLRISNVNQGDGFRYIGVAVVIYIITGFAGYLIWFVAHDSLLLTISRVLAVDNEIASMILASGPVILFFVVASNIGVQASALMLNYRLYFVAGLANLTAAILFLIMKITVLPMLSVTILIWINGVQICATALFYFYQIKHNGVDPSDAAGV